MNDAEYLFREYSRTKKDISRSSAKRKNGSRSKKCTLPSDYLSRKELRNMNGDVRTYKLAPMRWWEYKQLPDDLKKQFLQLCIDKNARTQDIAEMFGVCKATVNTEYNRLNIMKKRFMPTASQDEWERFLNGAEAEQPETEIVPEHESTNPNGSFTSCELEFSDVTRDSLGDIVTFLQLLMDGVCTIKISVKRDME